MRHYLWWVTKLVPLLLWIGIILGIASRPKVTLLPPDTDIIFGLGRQLIPFLYHVSAFFILAILFGRCFSAETKSGGSHRSWTISFIVLALISICSELIQFQIPTRTPAVRDLAVDLFGIVLGLLYMRGSR